MSKICAKCEKPVYPTEELKCLDKSWHKLCFKCWDCGTTLNMKNYKAFDKKPYCSAHCPQQKPTSVADTPELTRLARATQLQSQAKYHEDFERNIRGSKLEVVNDPESERMRQLKSVVSQAEYTGLRERVSDMDAKRSSLYQPQILCKPDVTAERSSSNSNPNNSHSSIHTLPQPHSNGSEPQQRKVGSSADYESSVMSRAEPHPLYSSGPAHSGSSSSRLDWERSNKTAVHTDSTVLTDSTRLRYAVTPPSTDSSKGKSGGMVPDNPVKHSVGSEPGSRVTSTQQNTHLSVNTDLKPVSAGLS